MIIFFTNIYFILSYYQNIQWNVIVLQNLIIRFDFEKDNKFRENFNFAHTFHGNHHDEYSFTEIQFDFNTSYIRDCANLSRAG